MDGKRFVLRRIKYSFCHVHSPARKSLSPATYALNTLHKTVNNGILIRLENLVSACEQWVCAKQRGRKAAHREPKVQSRSHGLSGSVGPRYEVSKTDESTHLPWYLKMKHAEINSILQNVVRNVTWRWSLLCLLWILWFFHTIFCYYKLR